MPLYEYECTVCGQRTEVLQRVDSPPLAACPECGEAVRRLLSAPSFQFKGSGWYVTDYGGKGDDRAKKDGESPSGDKTDGKKTDGKKSESKPSSDKSSSSKKADSDASSD